MQGHESVIDDVRELNPRLAWQVPGSDSSKSNHSNESDNSNKSRNSNSSNTSNSSNNNNYSKDL